MDMFVLIHAGCEWESSGFKFSLNIEPNVGIVAVLDPRLNVLSELSKSQRTVPASIEFVDIAGLVKRASQGEVNALSFTFFSSSNQILILYLLNCPLDSFIFIFGNLRFLFSVV